MRDIIIADQDFSTSGNRYYLQSADGEKDFVGFSEYRYWHHWHLELYRDAMIKRYGEQTVGKLGRNEEGCLYFEFDNNIDLCLIREDIESTYASSSCSCSSVSYKEMI